MAPRPPATRATFLRMSHLTSAARTTGFFRFHGRSHGASCPRVMETMPFTAPCGQKPRFKPYTAGKSTRFRIRPSYQFAVQPALQPLPTDALETQNA
jgi:hypothetical protein